MDEIWNAEERKNACREIADQMMGIVKDETLPPGDRTHAAYTVAFFMGHGGDAPAEPPR